MEKIFTERAHLMCPRMNFGIALSVGHPFDENRIKETFEILVRNHPFLTAVLGHDESSNCFFYDMTGASKVALMVREDALKGIDDSEVIKEYEHLTGYDWNIRKEGMLKAVVWSAKDETLFLLVFHHLLTVSHFEFSDGVYLSDKGKQNREWADRISRHRAERILEFISFEG